MAAKFSKQNAAPKNRSSEILTSRLPDQIPPLQPPPLPTSNTAVAPQVPLVPLPPFGSPSKAASGSILKFPPGAPQLPPLPSHLSNAQPPAPPQLPPLVAPKISDGHDGHLPATSKQKAANLGLGALAAAAHKNTSQAFADSAGAEGGLDSEETQESVSLSDGSRVILTPLYKSLVRYNYFQLIPRAQAEEMLMKSECFLFR